jgi:uncharacterized membrane protein YbaN (DUF454 family)
MYDPEDGCNMYCETSANFYRALMHRRQYSHYNNVYANNHQIVLRISSKQMHAVAYFLEALCYKSEGRGVRIPMRSMIFLIYLIFPAALWHKRRWARNAYNLTAICEPFVWKICNPRRTTTLYAPTACYRDSFTSF